MVYAGCDESLPPRNDPTSFLSTSLTFGSGLIAINGEDVTIGQRLVASGKNLYDDVLDEEEGVGGAIVVMVRGRPDMRRTIPIRVDDLVSTRMLYGSHLAIGVDSAVTFAVYWNQLADDGKPFWNVARGYREMYTPLGVKYYESDSLDFEATGTLKVFKKLPAITLPTIRFRAMYQLWNLLPPEPD
jgi:hypothetical protein